MLLHLFLRVQKICADVLNLVLRQITGHLQRLNKLEADLKSLSSSTASKAEYEKNRLDMKKIVDGIHDEVLEVKKQVLDLPRATKHMQ